MLVKKKKNILHVFSRGVTLDTSMGILGSSDQLIMCDSDEWEHINVHRDFEIIISCNGFTRPLTM